jgi:hypothetical protein
VVMFLFIFQTSLPWREVWCFGVWSVFPIYPSIAFELVVIVVIVIQLHVAYPILNLILLLCHVWWECQDCFNLLLQRRYFVNTYESNAG